MKRIKMQGTVSAMFLVLTALTAIVPDWLEAFGFDPDRHSGGAEWLLVAALGALGVSLSYSTVRRFRTART
jgi:hypothetical protein